MEDEDIDNSSDMGDALEQMLINNVSESNDLESRDNSDVGSKQCQESLSACHEPHSKQTSNCLGTPPLLHAGELGENPNSPIK